MDQCFWRVCLTPLDAGPTHIFGFSEFLASLALMVLAWTIGDERYRFRIRTAPIPLQATTYWIIAIVGVLALLTDLWRAERWPVISGDLITPSEWQALLGLLFLSTFLGWAWYAFIRPPVYGTANCLRYGQAMYRAILRGYPLELAVVADEFRRSARAIVRLSPQRTDDNRRRALEPDTKVAASPLPLVHAVANDILLMMADRRFCRTVVGTSPDTALAIFSEMRDAKRYGIPVGLFARNLINEALLNRDSFLFVEAEPYESGLLGHRKPLTQAMFSDYRMVEAIGTLFDPDLTHKRTWDPEQWAAYCRMVLMTFRDYLEHGHREHSFVLYRAFGCIEHALIDLYKINGMVDSAWQTDVYERLRVIVDFVKGCIDVLEETKAAEQVRLRVRDRNARDLAFDKIADVIFEIILAGATVRTPRDLCWSVQHNCVWGEFFNFTRGNTLAARVVQFRVRRLLYDEVVRMNQFPNFKGARILAFCMNVLGLTGVKRDYDRDSWALKKVVTSWVRRNYASLHVYNPRVAEACLVDGYAYDETRLTIVQTWPAEGLRREPKTISLPLDPPQAGIFPHHE